MATEKNHQSTIVATSPGCTTSTDEKMEQHELRNSTEDQKTNTTSDNTLKKVELKDDNTAEKEPPSSSMNKKLTRKEMSNNSSETEDTKPLSVDNASKPAAVVNPYKRHKSMNTEETRQQSMTTKEHNDSATERSAVMLPQWTCQKNETHQALIFSIHFQEKKTNSPQTKPTSLLVEGYAFYENIIGVAHRKTNGEEAFNLTL